ncbi:tetratricopeptide repeat protein [Candidatus Falkowbacteria bacterium]|nr:tetratricopeptide repeat protein [Candidatus Falkowbacteria bacterium]
MTGEINEIYTPELQKRVQELASQKRYKDSLSIINGMIAKDNNIRALSDKVAILGMDGQYDESIRIAEIALGKKPDDYLLWYYKGVSLFYLKNYSEALDSFDHCLQINRGFIKAIYKKIFILLFTNKLKEATGLFESTDLPIYEYNNLLNNIGYAFVELGDYEKSYNYLSRAKYVERNPIVFYNLAELFHRKKDYIRFIYYFIRAKLRKFRNHYWGKEIKDSDKENADNKFLGPGKMFSVKAQVRETKSILKLFQTPNWAALCNDTFTWFAINIPYELINNHKFKGDIDLLVKMPKELPPIEDGPARYRSFEIKSILVEKSGKARSLKRGKHKNALKQLKKLKEFGSDQVILLEIYHIERGFSNFNNFPTQEIKQEIINKTNLFKENEFGYLIIRDEPSATIQDGMGGILSFPQNILTARPHTIKSPFIDLIKYIDEFWKKETSNRSFGGISVISYCKRCKKLIILDTRDETMTCSNCRSSILEYL